MAKKNVAIEAADLPAGSPDLPKLTDVLAALGLINAQELARVTGLLVERYPDAEVLLKRGQDFIDQQLSAGAIDGIKRIVWAEAVEAIKTGKSVIVHDPVDLA